MPRHERRERRTVREAMNRFLPSLRKLVAGKSRPTEVHPPRGTTTAVRQRCRDLVLIFVMSWDLDILTSADRSGWSWWSSWSGWSSRRASADVGADVGSGVGAGGDT